ncbi:MAG: serine hydrolase [Pseudomonadales bacterium]|nr:serine hydrolase [Pseudomonadales bacterium]
MRMLKLSLVSLIAVLVWIALAVFLSLFGTWISSVVPTGDSAAFTEWAKNEIGTGYQGNAAFVLIEQGEKTDQFFFGADQKITGDTLFPTASFSKWITALAVMSLVESGKLDLDAPVANYITRWQLPESQFDHDQVTVRSLLSHTAGLTDGLGFGDYREYEKIPSLEDELANPRGSKGDGVSIKVGIEPGSEFVYSGGGYLILELVVEETSGMPFRDYVQTRILNLSKMKRSTYAYLGDLENASASYRADGSLAPTYKYASDAATGFNSSVYDLAKLMITILRDDGGNVLNTDSVRAMREPHGFLLGAGVWGLGAILYAPSPDGDYVFGHDGGNDPAINSTMRINPDNGDGIIVLVSGHPSLASRIGSEWVLWQTGSPDFLQLDRTLESAILPSAIGGALCILLVFFWGWRKSERVTTGDLNG